MLFGFNFILAEGNVSFSENSLKNKIEMRTLAKNNVNVSVTSTRVNEKIQNRLEIGKKLNLTVGEKRIMLKRIKANKIEFETNNISVKTKLNISEGDRTMLRARLSNGKNAEIKIMPDKASKTALARLRLKVCNETNNCTIELKEFGRGNKTQARYEIQVERHYKILGIFKAKAREKIEIDAETGEIRNNKRAWWRFLARAQDD